MWSNGPQGDGQWNNGPPQGQWNQGPPQGQWSQPPPQGQWNQGPPQDQWSNQGPPQGQWNQGPAPQGQWSSAPQQGGWDNGPQQMQGGQFNEPNRGSWGGGGQQGGYQGSQNSYNLPPAAPGPMGQLPMNHGPTPYPQGQPPPITQQGSGMTPQGGRKRALVVGCNYKGSKNALNGCINDAMCMQYLLTNKFGFRTQDIIVLTDDQANQQLWPTRANMLHQMQRLVSSAQPGDSIVFHYSGHGSQTKDWTGDESDGLNETLCPCDFQQAGQIVDNDLNKILVNPLPQGVRLHAIIDACHSGSMLDLECAAEFKNGSANWKNEYKKRPKIYKGTAGGEAIQFGAARDSQTAADTAQLSGHVSTGAATYSFIQAVERAGSHISYGRLLQEMDVNLAGLNKGSGGGSSSSGGGLGGLASSLLGGGSSSGGGGLGSIAGALLGGGGSASGGYKGQTPVLSSNMPFDLNRILTI